jgi:hypothetical protein
MDFRRAGAKTFLTPGRVGQVAGIEARNLAEIWVMWPEKVNSSRPGASSQTFAVSPALPVANRFPSGDHASERTGPVWLLTGHGNSVDEALRVLADAL